MNYKAVLICGCIFLILTACAPKKNLIVLLPDPDGEVGQVVVSNKGGTQILTEPHQSTAVASADAAPEAPVRMKAADVSEIFKDAIAAQPEAPLRFILYFHSGTTKLTAESERQISEVLKAIEVRNSKDITIVGHTDRVGKREANYQLGLERVDFIKVILVSRGVDPAKIEVTSHGEDNPLIQTEDEVAEPRNRRIEITVR